MNVRYKKFFECEVRHEYYPTPQFDTEFGLSDDFVLTPTPETSKLLADNKLLFRPGTTGFNILYQEQLNSQGVASFIVAPDTEIPLGTRFDFEMRLKTPHFTNITDLYPGSTASINPFGGKITRFDNRYTITDNNLSYQIDYLRPKVFKYKPNIAPDTPTAFTLMAGNPVGTLVVLPTTVERDPVTGEYVYPVNFEDGLNGPYSFRCMYMGTNSPFQENFFLDDYLYHQQPFGLISIYIGNDFDFSGGMAGFSAPMFTARFQSRRETLRYVLVSNDDTAPTLVLAESTPTTVPDSRWVTQFGGYTFTGPTSLTGTDYETLGKHVFAFDTDQDIPSWQEAKYTLAITKNTKVLKANVPGPSPASSTREVIIYV